MHNAASVALWQDQAMRQILLKSNATDFVEIKATNAQNLKLSDPGPKIVSVLVHWVPATPELLYSWQPKLPGKGSHRGFFGVRAPFSSWGPPSSCRTDSRHETQKVVILNWKHFSEIDGTRIKIPQFGV